MPRTNLSVILLTAIISVICYQQASQTRYASTVADAMNQIDMLFVDPVERRDLFEAAMDGMARELDPYSNYIPPDEYARLMEEIEQQFGGVGIVIDFDPETKIPIILTARPGAPAHRAGLRAGDRIVSIDGKETADLGPNGPVKEIRGEPGTQVVLGILSTGEDAPRDVTVVRDIIPIESVMGYERDEVQNWIFRLPDHKNIGYVWIESFGEDTSRELAKALKQINDQVDGLIVDVRTNAGGVLTAAVEVCDMFIPDGIIVTVRGRYLEREQTGKKGNEHFDRGKPMVVLADRFSASAAEIFSACMQDFGRATVIGERTWGKGTVQSVLEMEGGRSALRLTTATYWRPSGKNIHRKPDSNEEGTWGVLPDEGFEISYDDEEYKRFLRARSRRFAPPIEDDESEPTKESEAEQETEASTDQENDGENDGENDLGPFIDTQLQRAVEHIQSTLDSSAQD